MAAIKKYGSLKEFYPYYLSEHQNPTCRRLHFVGTALVFVVLFWALFTQTWWAYCWCRWSAMGLPQRRTVWAGHALFEHNKPATFTYPAWSLASDFILFWQLLIGKEKFNPKA